MDCKKTIQYMYILLICCLVAGLAYNIGFTRASNKHYRPIYVKYEALYKNNNLTKCLLDVGVTLTPAQATRLGERLKR